MCAPVAVFHKTLEIDQLNARYEIQFACLRQKTSLNIQRCLDVRRSTSRLEAIANQLGFTVAGKRKLSRLVEQVKYHGNPRCYYAGSICTSFVAKDGLT